MNEHLLIKVFPSDIKQIQKVNGLFDEDSLYVVEVKKVPINQRFTVYGEGTVKLLDTTIDDVLKEWRVRTEKGWVLRKQNVWKENKESYGDKRRYMELMKNYYPMWFKEFQIYYPEDRHDSFEQYHEIFMDELNKHKSKVK